MSKRTYYPDRGDLIEINFQPAVGREIDKRRPAIVLSPEDYNRAMGMLVAVPTTTNLNPGPMWIPMPAGYLPFPSQILCDYVKSFDFRDRSAVFISKVPENLVKDIVSKLLDLIDPIR